MKVFATLTTLLGASTATALFQNQLHSSNDMRMNQHSMKPSMGMSMESQMSQLGSSDRRMDMHKQTSNMYRDNLDMTSNMMGQEMRPSMMNQNMMGQEMRSNMRDVHRQNQALAPNQYFEKDDFGNYVYSYNDQLSEKSEEGNSQAIKGHYAYIMSNGVKRRVDYVADNQGFHIIRDNADPARIKRSVEPNLIQTRMTSVMDTSSLRDDTHNMHRMSNMRDRNLMGMEQPKYSNMMGRNILGQNSMGRDMMDRNTINQDMGRNMMGQQDTMRGNMMGPNIYNLLSNRGMTSDMPNIMSHNMMGKQQMHSNMMGQEMTSNAMNPNMLGQQEMTPNMMYRNMMDLSNNQMSSNMLNSRGMSSDMVNSNTGLMGQRMMQKMEIEHIPETYTSTRFF